MIPVAAGVAAPGAPTFPGGQGEYAIAGEHGATPRYDKRRFCEFGEGFLSLRDHGFAVSGDMPCLENVGLFYTEKPKRLACLANSLL